MQKFSIHYGVDVIELVVPSETIVQQASMRDLLVPPNPGALVEMALDAPIGSAPLQELARGAERVVIVVDDLTRPTPAFQLLPGIFKRLEQARVSRENITILVATGTHRPMTPTEMAAKVGAQTLECYRVLNHDCHREEELVDLGMTPGGTPVRLNRLVTDADLVIGVGNIVPHRYCGWAGGAKIVQPGVSGEETTAATHLMITKHPSIRLGNVENPVRHEIESVADRANLRFIVNTVLDQQANLLAVVAGDFRQAFRKGVELASQVYGAPLYGQAHVVIASAYPSDFNLWQAGKAFYAADLAVREGGVIILVSPCYEGMGEHDELLRLSGLDYSEIEAMILQKKVHDRIGAAAALALALIKARASLWLVADHITREQARCMDMEQFSHPQQAVDKAVQLFSPAIRLNVLHQATEILPMLVTNANE